MGLHSTDDREETCMNCRFAKPVLYEQIICGKTGEWEFELHSCKWFKPKEKIENFDEKFLDMAALD